jgi:hypothetical protein
MNRPISCDKFMPSSFLARSSGSGSARERLVAGSAAFGFGLVAGETSGDVCRSCGMDSEVSKTKKASPPSPTFMGKLRWTSFTLNSTCRPNELGLDANGRRGKDLLVRRSQELELAEADVEGRAGESPWRKSAADRERGVRSEPSARSTTTTSMAPLRVAGLMEFQVLDTEPEMERTYCIPADGRAMGSGGEESGN